MDEPKANAPKGAVWCEHITYHADVPCWIFDYEGSNHTHVLGDKFCRMCGKPRPKQPEKLWEKMRKAYKEYEQEGFTAQKGAKLRKSMLYSDIAIDEFFKLVDECSFEWASPDGIWTSVIAVNELKSKLEGLR